MKVVFINPPLSLETRYGNLSYAGGIEPPFGICYLASIIRNNHNVEIIDAQTLNLSLLTVLKKIQKINPDVIGISSTTPSIHSSLTLIQEIKNKLPHCITLLGGCHMSAIPYNTMEVCDAIDIGVIGEAETTITPLLKEIQKKNITPFNVKGVIFRDKNKLVMTKPAPKITNLDDLPFPAFDLLPSLKNHYRVPTQSVDRYPSTSLITSRGCMGKCSFCDLTVTGRRPRAHSAEYTFELMRWLSKEFGIKSIMFEDDNFLFFRKRLEQLGKLLIKEKLDITWSCTSRVDVINLKTLQLAKSLGCWQVLYGIETGSQKILNFYNKKITLDKIKQAIKLTKQAGLRSKGFIMLANPLETQKTLQKTLDFILSLPINDISLTFFTPYPGAPVYSEVKKYGHFEENWEKMSCFEPIFIPKGLTQKELKLYERKIYQKFYFRPKTIMDYLLRIKNKRHFLELVKSGIFLGKHIFSEKFKKNDTLDS